MPRTKIVATVGPASWAPEMLRALIKAGADVFRLNFSHFKEGEHGDLIPLIRKIADEEDKPVAILQDLGGPKIRTGPLAKAAVHLIPGESFILTRRDVPGSVSEVSVSYPKLPDEVQPGDQILVADGLIELSVTEVKGDDIHCKVIVGGSLSARKGIAVPSRPVGGAAITEKDRKDMAYGIKMGVDFIGISFVRGPEDIEEAKRLIAEAGATTPVIAKIERRVALDVIEDIVKSAYGIMVARGDLGVEVPLDEVPIIQKDLISLANRYGKPVITATQMLLSMVDMPRPTRAEVTDVANAIFDGTDAVMLSGETANGAYPEECVRTMANIARKTESEKLFKVFQKRRATPAPEIDDVISRNACDIADELGATTIVTPTQTGSTPRKIARYRPQQPIVAISPRIETVRRLMLSWGVKAYFAPKEESTDSLLARAEEIAKLRKYAKDGDKIVYTLGVPAGIGGLTNLIQVNVLGQAGPGTGTPS